MAWENAVWVGYNNRLRTGIDWYASRLPTQADPSYPVTIEMWAQTNYTSYNNDLTCSYSGNWGSGGTTKRASNSTPIMMAGPGTAYFTASYDGVQQFRVDFTCSGPGAGASSITRIGEVPRRPTAAPSACRSLTVRNITTGGALVDFAGPADWRGPTTNARYYLQISTTSAFTSTAWGGYVGGNWTVSGLQPGTTYYARVRGEATQWDGYRYGDWSNVVTFKTLTGVPAYVQANVHTAITSSGFEMSWRVPVANGGSITKYQWEVREGSDRTVRTGTLAASGETTGTSVTVSGLKNATNYTTHQRAFNGTNWGPWQVEASQPGLLVKTLPLPPTLSGSPVPSAVARTSFIVPTAAIANNGGEAPTNYRVAVWPANDSSAMETFIAGTWSPITIPNRLPVTAYRYNVAAYNSGGWGPWSPVEQTVTTLETAPGEAGAVVVDQITETSARATWSQPPLNGSTLTNYTLVISKTGTPTAPEKTFTLEPGTTTQVVTGLVKGTTYQAFVRANATPTSSGWSPAAEFRTVGDRSTLIPMLNDAGVWKRFQMFLHEDGAFRRVLINEREAAVWKKEEA